MATYLLDPKPGPNWYTKEKLTDPELLALAGKVKTVGKTAGLHELFKKFRAGSFPEVTVKIVLKNGKEYSETVRFPKGHPKNRLTFDEGSEMFRRGASFALNAKKTEAAIDRILHLDELPDVELWPNSSTTKGRLRHGEESRLRHADGAQCSQRSVWRRKGVLP